jgi:hypothetical protein
LLVLMRKRLNGILGAQLWKAVSQGGGAALVMSGALYALLRTYPNAPTWLQALGGVVIGVIVFLLMVVLMRVPEVYQAQFYLNKFIRARFHRTKP